MNPTVAAAPLHERQDARELFGKISARFHAGAELFGMQDLANDLGWPLARVATAMVLLEQAGLVQKPTTGHES